MRIAMFGASRGCGFEALLLLLAQGGPQMEIHTLIRKEELFQSDLAKRGVDQEQSKKLHIFVGDALYPEQVKAFFQTVANNGHIDSVVSSLGIVPDLSFKDMFGPIQLPKGLENICSDTMKNILDALETIAPFQQDKKIPQLVVCSSNGMGKSGHDALPLLLKPFYGIYLKHPHADKVKMETLLHQRYNIVSEDFNPKARVQNNAAFDASKLYIIRPSLLTDGKAKLVLRSSESTLPSAWTISRKDVGAYIAHNCLSVGEKVAETKTKSSSTAWKNGLVLSY